MIRKIKNVTSLTLFLMAAIIFSCCTGEKSAGHADDEKVIREHIDKIFRAYMSKDTQIIKSTHSKEWRGFLSYSNTILRGIDDYMNDAFSPDFFDKKNQWHIVSYKMLDYDIVFHEQTGIICYIAEVFWQDGEAKGSYKLRCIDIYGKENGEWNQIASNIGPLPSEN